MKSWWVGFTVDEQDCKQFEYRGPWWVTGYGEGFTTFVAAVRAESEEAAETVIYEAFDAGAGPRSIRFVEARPEGWNPLKASDRFKPADWMKWPWPAVTT